MVKGLLVIVPCGQGKVWDKRPWAEPTPAALAYTGAPFKVNREYAEAFAERWVILSAKYGFIDPQFIIPERYEVTFKNASSSPVAATVLRTQVRQLELDGYETVVVLGGKEYQAAVRAAFSEGPARLVSPFAGLPIGKAMQATKQAIASGMPIGQVGDAARAGERG